MKRPARLTAPLCAALVACGGTRAEAPPPNAAHEAPRDAGPATGPDASDARDAAAPDANPDAAANPATAAPARLRFVHAAADRNLPAAEVHYNGANAPSITALEYLHADGYAPLPAGAVEVTVLRNGAPPTTAARLDTTTPPLAPGDSYTAVLHGTSTMYSPGLLLSVARDTAPVLPPERAAVRFFNAYIAHSLDACVDARPLVTNLAFGAWSSPEPYLEINPGTLRVRLRHHADAPCTGAPIAAFTLDAPADSVATFIVAGADVPPDAATHSSGSHKQRRRGNIGTAGNAENDQLAVLRCGDPFAADTSCRTLTVEH